MSPFHCWPCRSEKVIVSYFSSEHIIENFVAFPLLGIAFRCSFSLSFGNSMLFSSPATSFEHHLTIHCFFFFRISFSCSLVHVLARAHTHLGHKKLRIFYFELSMYFSSGAGQINRWEPHSAKQHNMLLIVVGSQLFSQILKSLDAKPGLYQLARNAFVNFHWQVLHHDTWRPRHLR